MQCSNQRLDSVASGMHKTYAHWFINFKIKIQVWSIFWAKTTHHIVNILWNPTVRLKTWQVVSLITKVVLLQLITDENFFGANLPSIYWCDVIRLSGEMPFNIESKNTNRISKRKNWDRNHKFHACIYFSSYMKF
jgi:hypothetical protein